MLGLSGIWAPGLCEVVVRMGVLWRVGGETDVTLLRRCGVGERKDDNGRLKALRLIEMSRVSSGIKGVLRQQNGATEYRPHLL